MTNHTGVNNGWFRLRQYAADNNWPFWSRVCMARPHAYSHARKFWGWPRRHALGYALAPLVGRVYRRRVVSRVKQLYRLNFDPPTGTTEAMAQAHRHEASELVSEDSVLDHYRNIKIDEK